MRRATVLVLLQSAPGRADAPLSPWTPDDILLRESASGFLVSPDGRWAVWVKGTMDRQRGERVNRPVRIELAGGGALEGADDAEVEGILYYPHDHRPGERRLLVVMVHGGPALQDANREEGGPLFANREFKGQFHESASSRLPKAGRGGIKTGSGKEGERCRRCWWSGRAIPRSARKSWRSWATWDSTCAT